MCIYFSVHTQFVGRGVEAHHGPGLAVAGRGGEVRLLHAVVADEEGFGVLNVLEPEDHHSLLHLRRRRHIPDLAGQTICHLLTYTLRIATRYIVHRYRYLTTDTL